MAKEQNDNICALCKWSKDVEHNFFCGHQDQTDSKLKKNIYYNDTCELFEEKEERKFLYL